MTTELPKGQEIAVELIKEFEGFESVAYQDIAGVWTIGYGSTQGVKAGDTITKAEATALLTKRVSHDLFQLAKWTTEHLVSLNRNQIAALLSFCYNFNFEKFRDSTLARKIRDGAPLEEIQFQFNRWVNARVEGTLQPVKGLVRRRNREAELYGTPVHLGVNSTQAETIPPPPVNYAKFVQGLVSQDYNTIVRRFTHPAVPNSANMKLVDLLHAVLGLITELGELTDPLKKSLFYGKPLDDENIIEEIGDLRWYLQLAVNTTKLTDSQIVQRNIDKLSKRYPGAKFSETAALSRADKAPNDTPTKT